MTEVTIQAKSTNPNNENLEYLTHWFTTMTPSLFPIRTMQSLSLFGISSWYNEQQQHHHHHHTYDWDKSTEDNYKSDTQEFRGTFQSIRQRLDHTYHQNYVPSRQAVQDEILEGLLHSTIAEHNNYDDHILCRPEESWIIFTAGVYGTKRG
jgi:hypothetical protein